MLHGISRPHNDLVQLGSTETRMDTLLHMRLSAVALLILHNQRQKNSQAMHASLFLDLNLLHKFM